MSYDPNSNQIPEPNRSRPDYENPNSYEIPNTLYEGAPNPDETPNTFYGNPPSTSYGIPEASYGTATPPRHPLPLSEAIRELPNQYIRVITKPGTGVFAEEQSKAAWNIIWVQLLVLAVFTAIIGLVTFNSSLGANAFTAQQAQSVRPYSGAFSILFLIFTPIGFFIGTGIYHLIAKAFGGRGTFLAYCYSYLLFGVPLGIIGGVIGLIPFIGSLLALAIGVYQIVLQVYMTMAVHRLTGGRATLAVLILPIVAFIVAILVTIIAVATVATHSR